MNHPIKLSIIIPAKDEEKRIVETLKSVQVYMDDTNDTFEVIVVENNSTDNTARVVTAYQKKMPQLKLVSLGFDCGGKGCAVKRGIKEAQGEYIVFMDADNATHINEIAAFWPEFKKGYDVVIGSRHVTGAKINIEQPWYRQILGRSANLLIQATVLWGIKDTQCGFKAFTHESAKKIFTTQEVEGWGFDIEILAIAKAWGYRIKEMPVNWYHVGESRLRPLKAATSTLKDLFTVKINLLKGRYKKPA
jgi:dolichyl-phosphate beta-glucosyltransferase